MSTERATMFKLGRRIVPLMVDPELLATLDAFPRAFTRAFTRARAAR